MPLGLPTRSEQRAEAAQRFPAFLGVSLLNIKQQLSHLLGLVGRDGIFDEYTVHDISHIEAALNLLNWLIPEPTATRMTPADWLLTVLAIYFHDFGMLVTKHEYESRNSSGFPEFRDKVLFGGEHGEDYRAKIQVLPLDRAERFLYQEFVRHKHAERIRTWIVGDAPERLGLSSSVMTEVDRLLSPLGAQFRRDLALVCESHHLEDLDNFKKYKVSQPYGNSEDETADVHYAAILLRTADLLHITSDRTPSVMFNVISPTDPVSQGEWAKQMAVKSVRPKLGRNREGMPDQGAPRDTIEVYAYFTQEEGFFALTEYLVYAEDQIRRSYEWIKLARTSQGSTYDFPWRHIDDSSIETEGFLRETFQFTLDQTKILDLLTGHTLYNDTSVVMRELVQNALDAVRLQRVVDTREGRPTARGKVAITWNSESRALSVEDDGTGMTQEIVERHLLKVGSSRYQDPEFKRDFPDFTPISRFGIGILSAFMIADSVEILTCHPDEEKARQLSLRSVHGRYLIRLLNKNLDPSAKALMPHGTRVRLQVRASADIGDVVKSLRRWVVVPSADVSVTVDGGESISIGFQSPREALADVLSEFGISITSTEATKQRFKIEEKTLRGVTVAYGLEWSDFFNEWSFLVPPPSRPNSESEGSIEFGTCIEGIRVEFGSPGFEGVRVASMANAVGPQAPKTNVARSGFEVTPQREDMLDAVYAAYCDHVRTEMRELHERRRFSLTWAAQEAAYLLRPLMGLDRHRRRDDAVSRDQLMTKIQDLPLLIVDQGGQRRAISPAELCRADVVWTVDGEFFRSAEHMMREVPTSASISALVQALQAREITLPTEPILCGFVANDVLHRGGLRGKEVDLVRVFPEQRRVDLRWAPISREPRWASLPYSVLTEVSRRVRERIDELWTLQFSVSAGIEGLRDELAVHTFGKYFIRSDSELGRYMVQVMKHLEGRPTPQAKAYVVAMCDLVLRIIRAGRAKFKLTDRAVDNTFSDFGIRRTDIDSTEYDMMVRTFNSTDWRTFDPSVWVRKEKQAYESVGGFDGGMEYDVDD